VGEGIEKGERGRIGGLLMLRWLRLRVRVRGVFMGWCGGYGDALQLAR
jgi:hypothetical protein